MKNIFIALFVILQLPAISQNVGIGTNSPANKLHVVGNFLVNQVTVTTATAPTGGQTGNLISNTNITFNSTDSTDRLYDPGGPAGNYSNNTTSTATYPAGTEIATEVTIENIGLASGDSLILRDVDYTTPHIYLALGPGNAAPGKYILNFLNLQILLKSNNDGITGSGFSILLKRIYPGVAAPPVSGMAGIALLFDSQKGAFRAGNISNDETIGIQSAALGKSHATADYSFATGNSSATGISSAAFGNAQATGNSSMAAGVASATADGAVALGGGSASGYYSFATSEGTSTGDYSTALGFSHANGLVASAMGNDNFAVGDYSTAMGNFSEADGDSAIAIGNFAQASGKGSTAIGDHTVASGAYSTAVGNFVSTSNFTGAYAIGDRSTNTTMTSFVANGYRARFAGGYRLFTEATATIGAALLPGANAWSTLSDRRRKENFESVNGEDFLKKIAAMPLTTWNYIGQDRRDMRHYGPMAQDFFEAFGKDKYGTIGCDTLINQQDLIGVNLIATQALIKRTDELQKENAELKKMLIDMRGELDRLKRKEIDSRTWLYFHYKDAVRKPDMVKGNLTDEHSRCRHYHSALDIIAIKMKCCGEYYACIHCHEELADHSTQQWKKEEFETKAVLCGNCKYEMSINEYLNAGYQCPVCKSAFNPQCSNHNQFYFER